MAQYDISLRDYLRILRKRKIIVVFSTIMLGMTSFAAAFMSRPAPQYSATAKVQYEKTQSAEEAYAQALAGGDDLETQQAVIKSYPVVTRVAKRLGRIDTTYTDKEIAGLPKGDREKIEGRRIREIEGIRSSIQTSVEGLTNIISIIVTQGNPQEAPELANTVAEEYLRHNVESRNKQAMKRHNFVEKQRNAVEEQLRAAQDTFKLFQEKTQIISVDAQTRAALSKLTAAQEALDRFNKLRDGIDRLIAQSGSSNDVLENSFSSIPPEEGGATFNQLNGQLQSLNMERNRLLVNYTEEHPQVQDLDTRKGVIIRNMLASLRTQRDVVSRRIKTQQDLVDVLKQEYRRIPDQGIQLEELRRDVEVQAGLLEFYEREYQKSQIEKSSQAEDVTILQRALTPSAPINPFRPEANASIGIALGLIVGLVFAFILETFDMSIGTIEDVEEFLGVSVVGIIPHIDIEDIREAQAKTGQEIDPEALERRMRLAAHFEPRSNLAESYRALRTNIQFATMEKGAKVISITSASNQEGKSTTIANLAMTLAQAGNRTLLVDCDLRRPTINRIFGLEREPGLTDVILGNYSWQEVVRTVTDIMVGGLGMEDIMMTPGMDNLSIITCGVIPSNPAEITDSRSMGEFIKEVRDQYDVVLFDAPPVLQATDAAILGTKMDGVLLVYKVGNVSRGALRRAKAQLDNVNVPVLGVILNGLRPEVSGDVQDLPYYSYYSYGSEGREQSGNAFKRYYNRTLRRLKAFWKKSDEQVRPYVHAVRSRLGRDKAATPPPTAATREQSEEFEGRGVVMQALHILFWIFLVLFLAAGILWQLNLLGSLRSILVSALRPESAPTQMQETPEVPEPETVPSEPQKPSDAKPSDTKKPDAQPGTTSVPITSPPPERQMASSPKPVEEAAHPVVHRASLVTELPQAPRPRFAIHVASYKTRTSAQQDVQTYRKQGYTVHLARVDIPKRGVFYRVLVGQFLTRQDAGKAAEELKQIGITGYAAVVNLPKPASVPPPRTGSLQR